MRRVVFTVAFAALVFILYAIYQIVYYKPKSLPLGPITIAMESHESIVATSDPLYNTLVDYITGDDTLNGQMSITNHAYDMVLSCDWLVISYSNKYGNAVTVSYKTKLPGISWNYRVREETPSDIAIKVAIKKYFSAKKESG